jgi:lipoyl-dependent peroxiredoxin
LKSSRKTDFINQKFKIHRRVIEMAVRHAEAVWTGPLKEGAGTIRLGTGSFEGPFSFSARFEEGSGTNPDELIAAALAGCFTMALSGELGKAGYTPGTITTRADTNLEKKEGQFWITNIHLTMTAEVDGIDEENFQRIADATRTGCIVARALGGVEITLDAHRVMPS